MGRYFIFTALLCIQITGNCQLVFEWTKQITSTSETHPVSIDRDAAGDIYTAGYFIGDMDLDPGPGTFMISGGQPNPLMYYNSYAAKYDSAGNFIWGCKLGSTSNILAVSMDIDYAGNMIITGFFELTADVDPSPTDSFLLTSNGSYDAFVCKLDNAGNFVWAKQLGGLGIDEAHTVTTDPSGGIYFAGNFATTIDFDPGDSTYLLTSDDGYNPFILHLDAAGNFVWAAHFSGDISRAYGITTDNAGSVYCIGNFQTILDVDPGPGTFYLNGYWDPYIVKLNNTGGLIWAKQITGMGNSYGYNITPVINNEFVISGSFQGTTDFDPGPGTYYLDSSPGNDDPYIVKLDTAGNLIWVKSMPTDVGDPPPFIQLDGTGSVYVASSFYDTVDVDPGAGVIDIVPAGGISTYLVKLDNSGQFQWSKKMGGTNTGDGVIPGPMVAQQNLLYHVGNFGGTCDLNPDAATLDFTSPDGSDAYILELSTFPFSLPSDITSHFLVYPNPSTDKLTVDFGTDYFNNITLEIVDIYGQSIYSIYHCNTPSTVIPTDHLIPGIYFIRIISGNVVESQKIVIH